MSVHADEKSPRTSVYELSQSNETHLSTEQRKILDCCLSGQNVFITGPGGTGKSFLLSEIVKAARLRHSPSSVYVTAATGVAALQISGITLHSYTLLGLCKEPIEKLVLKARRNNRITKRWQSTKVLIIDEISMIDSSLYDKLETFAREIRGNHEKPWGGIQVILLGDFLQLPPVGENSRFAFQAERWLFSQLQIFQLTEVFRQRTDPEFTRILLKIRFGITDEEVENFLSSRLISKLRKEPSSSTELAIEPTLLFSHRSDVDRVNRDEYEKLSSKTSRVFIARDKAISEVYYQSLDQMTQVPSKLELCVGAQVMLTKNSQTDPSLVNGSRGIIRFLGKTKSESISQVQVEFCNNKLVWITSTNFDIYVADELVASREQLPLVYAWATTIHKSQGLSLDCLEVSLDKAFSHGQVYVALSRATSRDRLYIRSYELSKIQANPQALQFYKNLEISSDHGNKKN